MTARGFLDPLDWMWRNGLANLSAQRQRTNSSALADARGAAESRAGAARVRSTSSSKLLYYFLTNSSALADHASDACGAAESRAGATLCAQQ